MSADDFNELREKIPEFDEALKNLAAKRIKENINFLEQDNLERQNWANQAIQAIDQGTAHQLPTRTDLTKRL